jgi:CubicO group peptidase (beta-lactamase class C family)
MVKTTIAAALTSVAAIIAPAAAAAASTAQPVALAVPQRAASASPARAALRSPDQHIAVTVREDGGKLTYAIARDGKPVLLASDLGLQLAGADLRNDLTLLAASRRASSRSATKWPSAKSATSPTAPTNRHTPCKTPGSKRSTSPSVSRMTASPSAMSSPSHRCR